MTDPSRFGFVFHVIAPELPSFARILALTVLNYLVFIFFTSVLVIIWNNFLVGKARCTGHKMFRCSIRVTHFFSYKLFLHKLVLCSCNISLNYSHKFWIWITCTFIQRVYQSVNFCWKSVFNILLLLFIKWNILSVGL